MMDYMDYEVTEPGLIKIKIPRAETPSFELVSAKELTLKPRPINWLIRNLIEKESINLLYGPPASGKSLFALDWGFCIAKGMMWEGRMTQQADVVIIAGEGFAGYARRLKALELKYGIKAPENLLLSKQSAQLQAPGSCDDVVKAMQRSGIKPGLIIIDTLNRNIDADENSSRDIAAFISNLDQFFKPLGAAVLVVHHSGHNEAGRSRGSSAIRAAMDAEYCVSKDENTVTLSCTKAKDFEPQEPLDFALQQVSLDWLDDEMAPLTSVYLKYAGSSAERPRKNKLTPREEQIMQALNDAIRDHGIDPPAEIKKKFGGFGSGTFAKKIVKIDDWRPYAFKAISDDPATNRQAFRRFRNKFLGGMVMEHNGHVWRIDDVTSVTSRDKNENVTSFTGEKERDKALRKKSADYFEDLGRDSLIEKTMSRPYASNDKALSDDVTSVTSRDKRESVTGVVRDKRDTPLRGVTDVTPEPTPDFSGDDVEIF